MKHNKSFHYSPYCSHAVILLLCAIFALLTAGGCGSSSSSVFSGGYVPTDANAAFSGAWRYSSGTVTATLNGTTHNLTVMDFAVYFADCNVESDHGTATFAAAAPLRGENFMIPLIFDTTTIATTRIDIDQWTASTDHGAFTVTLLSDTEARLTGKVALNTNTAADIDIALKKVTQTSTQLDIDTVLDGTWQTPISINDDGSGTTTGGGCVFFSSGDVILITSTFANMIFEDTSIADETTTFTTNMLLALFDEAGETTEGNMSVIPGSAQDFPLSISHIFGNVYRLKVDDNQKGALLLSDDKTAYFILSAANSVEVESVDVDVTVHGIFFLTKKTGTDTVSITSQVGTTWTAVVSSAFLVVNDNPTVNLMADNISVSFPEADVENRTVKFNTSGKFTYTDASGQEIEIPLDLENCEAAVERVGYNTYFAVTPHQHHKFMITMFDDDTAIVSATLTHNAESYVSITVLMVKSDTDVNAVWKGAWRYASGDVSMMQNGTPINLSVLDFAAYFDDVDVDGTNGTAVFSAVANLSADMFLLPMVFDGEDMTTVRLSDTEWRCTTEHGNFTAKLTAPGYAELSGTVNYSVGSYTLALNIDVTLVKVASAALPTVNIDSVLNGTWQSVVDENAEKGSGGGFLVMNNTLYPGVSTFANMIFKDTSLADNKTVISSVGMMRTVTFAGAAGPSIPMTMFDMDIEISHIFSNFYRIALGNDDKGSFDDKGLLVVQDENHAYFINNFVDDVYGIQAHSLFMLEKKTGADTVTLTSLSGTSWDVIGSGTIYDTASGTHNVSFENASLSLLNVSDTALTQHYKSTVVSEGYTSSMDIKVRFELQKIGYNSWHGTVRQGSDVEGYGTGVGGAEVMLTMFNDKAGISSSSFIRPDNVVVSSIGIMRRQ